MAHRDFKALGSDIHIIWSATRSPSSTSSMTIGDDRLIFSIDFPHGDSKFPRAVASFLELPIAEASKRKILWDNGAAYYGLPA